uniref:Protein kinase domain-containing protein n=1 Tax=Rhizophora mucronata TaxID=61149 RepID=A0A2P2Q4G4_RHIMU
MAGHTHVSTAVVGTYGYAAPDYIKTGHLTTKSDVWSFGVVLYEILTGRRSLERNLPTVEQELLEWVKQFPVDSKKFGLMMDPRLENQYSISTARSVAKLANKCLSKSPKDRPKMSQVMETLEQLIQDHDSNEVRPSNDCCFESCGNDRFDSSEKPNVVKPSESRGRRMAHLAKLGAQLVGASTRRFTIMQRAK